MRTLCYGLTVVASLLVVVLLLVFRPWVRAIHPIENTEPTDSVDLQHQPEKTVTDTEKKEFLKLLATLPTRGEFFAKEAIPKAAPHTRVLLALTEKDLEKFDLYPFLALSAGLMGDKEARQFASANFGEIAHPQIKLGWAIMLFRDGSVPPEVVLYLRKALDTEPESKFGLGPGFQDFKEEVIRASEAGKLLKVELVKQHTIRAFPEFGGGQDYRNRDYIFAPGGIIYAVRPLRKQQCGELISYDIAKGKASSRLIPQPAGFKPQHDFTSYFDRADLAVNAEGHLLCFWMIKGNGDHGFALLKKGAADFQINRVASYLMGSRIVPASDGSWYVIQDRSGFFVIHHLDKDLNLAEIGKIRRRQSARISDALFISSNGLHLFTTSEEDAHVSLRSIDFDTKERKVLHNREMHRVDRFTLGEGLFLQLQDGTLHYLWSLEYQRDDDEPTGKEGDKPNGIYYQAEADSTNLKVGDGIHYCAISVGDRIVVCYTKETAPNKAYFRVIRHGALGPVTEVTIDKDRKHSLWTEDMILHAEADRIWFVNTLAPNGLYELKLVDTTKP
jgi:hypothetical protein